jgi:glycosyltransferase involved in cell wall biosynthesis
VDIPVGLESRAIVLTEIEAMGGAERSVLALSRWLLAHGVPHHFVTYVDHIDMAARAGHPITVVQLRPAMRAANKVLALRRYFAARRGAPAALMSAYQPVLHATLAGMRGFHCLLHDTPSLFEPTRVRTAGRRLVRSLSDRIAAYGLQSGGRTIVASEYLRDETRRVFGVEADIARMGGMSGAATFRPRQVTTRLRMLSVSRVEPNKRIDWILRALAAMESEPTPLSSRIDWSLDIAGEGSQLDALRALTHALRVAERVHFLGYVSDDSLERLYGEAHLFLMPALQGYGIPAVEALTRGLPVLLHRDSGVSDILLATPWATVIQGGEDNLLPGLRRSIDAVIAGTQLRAALPALPTEAGWATRVAGLCGWIPPGVQRQRAG